MRKVESQKKRWYIIAVAAALILSLIAELTLFASVTCPVYSSEAVSLMDSTSGISMSCSGYSVVGEHYKQVSDDPQIVFLNMDETVGSVLLSFSSAVYTRPEVQVFYHTKGEGFSAKHSTDYLKVPFASSYMVIAIPEGQYEGIRFDIDGEFALRDVTVSASPIKLKRQFTGPFDILQVFIMFLALSVGAVLLVYWMLKKRTTRDLLLFEWLFLAACFVFYALWAVAKPLNYGPDEHMRYQVTQFLFEYGRLPVYDELIEKNWGFSYAHFPTVLCNLLGYVFMKIASFFTTGSFKLLIAARMVSVCAATGVVYYVIKISKQLFRPLVRWIFIVFVAFMPQFAFLSSYINNDSLALLGVAMILYAWVLGLKFNWEWRSALLLAIGVAVCGLSYHNSYSWILASIFLFIISYFYQNKKDYKGFWKLLTFIVVIVVLMIGYRFIRQVVLYGDLFGFKPRRYYGELYAIESLKPSVTTSLHENGGSLWQMLFSAPYNFAERALESFVGVFGPMNVFCSDLVYLIIYTAMFVGVVGLIWRIADMIVNKRGFSAKKWMLLIGMVFSVAVVVGLAIYKSYTGDFQPQGRYCYPAFVAIMLWLAKGYEFMILRIKKKEYQYVLTTALCTGFVSLSVHIFFSVYLPS